MKITKMFSEKTSSSNIVTLIDEKLKIHFLNEGADNFILF